MLCLHHETTLLSRTQLELSELLSIFTLLYPWRTLPPVELEPSLVRLRVFGLLVDIWVETATAARETAV